MLYMLASDILGERPIELGECRTVGESCLNYEKIGPAINKGSEFLMALENLHSMNGIMVRIARINVTNTHSSNSLARSSLDLVSGENDPVTVKNEDISPEMFAMPLGRRDIAPRIKPRYLLLDHKYAVKLRNNYVDEVRNLDASRRYNINIAAAKYPIPVIDTIKAEKASISCGIGTDESRLVFCIPPNYDLLQYWDRVEDRLFKIHNCMNISGLRRQLALFQPPINPMLLVKATAAGLSLEDVISRAQLKLPPYRFSYLLERAKQFAATVQDFGSKLLSALEKKDTEELNLLRTVHEQNILSLTKRLKEQAVEEKECNLKFIEETEKSVQERIDFYDRLIEEGLLYAENQQEDFLRNAKRKRLIERGYHRASAFAQLAPLISVGSDMSTKFGGLNLGPFIGSISSAIASSIGVEHDDSSLQGWDASFERNKQQWNHQSSIAQKEMGEIAKQKEVAQILIEIAQEDLNIHEQNMKQVQEQFDFYKDKFTSLGLYEFLSSQLKSLHRQAYNIALELADMAEQAYGFERDDDTAFFIQPDNWQVDRVGLLAGERLLLQLQEMEKAYVEQNKRDHHEVTQTFSIALLDPSELLALRQTGTCEFFIPEIAYDMLYPGGYDRRIKSPSITIPCVTGPYTNVSGKLSLEAGFI